MSLSTTVTVPEGMSCVNAFHALWEKSNPSEFFFLYPDSYESEVELVTTAEKVTRLFNFCTQFEEDSRELKMDFSEFPVLDIRLYDKDFGQGAAKKALEEYNKIPSSERFDKNDSYKFEDLVKKI